MAKNNSSDRHSNGSIARGGHTRVMMTTRTHEKEDNVMSLSKCRYTVCKYMRYFSVGLYSAECECPSGTCLQTNGPLTEEEGRFVRHKRWDCSTQCKCVYVCCV